MADYSVTSESENLRLQMRRMMDGLHVAMPAKVLAFQPGPPARVTVQPTTQMKITLGEEVSYRSLPQLSGVPVVLPFAQTAGFLLTVPIQPGDTGLLVIPDRGLDNFLQAGDVAAPPFYGDPTLIQPRAATASRTPSSVPACRPTPRRSPTTARKPSSCETGSAKATSASARTGSR